MKKAINHSGAVTPLTPQENCEASRQPILCEKPLLVPRSSSAQEPAAVLAQNAGSVNAYRYPNDPRGRIVCCWQMNWKARLRFLFTGKIWHQILTFNYALQPQLLSVEKPEMKRNP